MGIIVAGLFRYGRSFYKNRKELILMSRKVSPKRLLDESFVFEINEANERQMTYAGKKRG
jgi:hypothetical protein